MTATDTPTTTTPGDGAPADRIERPAWLTDVAWPYPIRSLPFRDTALAYTDVGEGPVVLLVHVGTWSFVWRDLVAELAGSFRCVTFDAPGNGLSGGSSKVDLELAAAAVDAVVTQLGLDDLVLVLHDLGGVAGLLAAERWPQRVRGLVAVNTFGWRPSGAAFRGMLALMGSAVVRESDALTGWLPRATATRFGVGRRWPRELRRVFLAGVPRRGRRSFHRYMRSARRIDGRRLDRAVAGLAELPLLTAFGARNDPLGFQARWRERFDDVVQLEIPGGNHFPMCDDPVRVAAAISTRFAA